MISRWFSNSDDDSASTKPMVHWCRTVCGPVGNCGDSCLKDQNTFNSIKWLSSQRASLGGFIIHAGEYVNCIQLIGNTEQPDTGMLTTDVLFRLWEVPCCFVDKNLLGSSNANLTLSFHAFFLFCVFFFLFCLKNLKNNRFSAIWTSHFSRYICQICVGKKKLIY